MKEKILEYIAMFGGASIACYCIYNFLSGAFTKMWSNKLNEYIDKAFEAGDDIDDKLLLAHVIWAEEKIERKFPGQSGLGYEKYALVAYELIKKIQPGLPWFIKPFIKPDQAKIKEVIEKNVLKMKELLKKQIEEKKAEAPVVIEDKK